MNRIEFLERLERLLLDIPYTERREALNYYMEYFEDAEKDDEEVVRTLGSPEEAAHNIREELAGKELTEIVDVPFEHAGAKSDYDAKEDTSNMKTNTNSSYYETNSSNSQGSHSHSDENGFRYNATGADQETGKAGKKQLEGWQIALIIVGAVVLFPVYGGLIVGGLGACFGVIAGFFGIILGLMAASVGLAIASVAVLIIAIVRFAISPLASLFLIGLSIFLAGIAMLCMIASWKSITVLIPAIWKGIVYIWNSIFHRKEGVTV